MCTLLTSNVFQETGCVDSHLNVNDAVGKTVTSGVFGVMSGVSGYSSAAEIYPKLYRKSIKKIPDVDEMWQIVC